MPTDKPMQLGMVGLGRMGAGIVRRLTREGHHCVGYDVSADAVHAVESEGIAGARTLEEFAAKLDKPRRAWVMVPAGDITSKSISALAEVFEAGDAFYLPPGHIPVGNEPGSETVQFSPTKELRKTQEVMRRNAQAMQPS